MKTNQATRGTRRQDLSFDHLADISAPDARGMVLAAGQAVGDFAKRRNSAKGSSMDAAFAKAQGKR